MAKQGLEMCQQQADEVTVLMKDNAEKVFEREGKLSDLENRSEALKNLAGDFQKTAQKVERKTRWEKWRWYIIFGVIVLVIVIIIIIVLAVTFGGGGGGGEEKSQSP
ncbi:vesicle-associated membrane protein 5 [Mantella aurantiaca]